MSRQYGYYATFLTSKLEFRRMQSRLSGVIKPLRRVTMAADKDLVNFSEEHELNYCLKSTGKRQTQANRDALVDLGKQVKQDLGKRVLTQDDVKGAIEKNGSLFE
jgi:hypothetical protein